MSEEIAVSTDSGVGTIRIDRPAKKNALTTAMYGAMADALEAFGTDDSVRIVKILGGADFSAGNDLQDFTGASASGDTAAFVAVIRFLERLCDFPKPVVAGVRGNAIGIGTTMLLHAAVAVAATSARFRLPFAQLGLVPEAGSTLLLPLAVGRMRATWLLLAGDFFGADEALAMGLVTKTADDAQVDAAAGEIAARLAALPAEALRETKRLIREPISDAVRTQM
ncbi:MAG TPA: enoyl-CoA hydratase-related protein, partial [Candidatus Tumulicola sp.]|nr:enoyl-CoA hydratase-related protein [Candidatus Tumulicola sp.]